MKLGILYTIGGSIAFIGVIMGILFPFIFPEDAPHIITIIGKVVLALFLGLYMLPRGLIRIREAKHESQTN